MKRIAIVGPCYPYRGGNSLFMTHLYHALERTFELKMFNYSLLYPSILFPGTTQYDESSRTIDPVPNERTVNSINPISWIVTAAKIKEFNPDLVVFDWWNPFFGPALYGICKYLGRSFSGKILFVTENVISHEGRMIDRLLTRIGLAKASAFLALSGVVVKDLQPIARGRKVYQSELPIYDCYEMGGAPDKKTSRLSLDYDSNDFLLLFFGYIRKYKGLDVLLRAVPLVRERAPNTKLLVVGESYDDIELYRRLVFQLGVAEYVKIINRFVPNEEVGQYYHAADLVVLPYREATQSGILNIAYGFDKPVVVTRVGGLAEFVDEGKTGYIVEPESPNSLADGILKFYQNRSSTDYVTSIRYRTQSNKFSKIAELFESILNEVPA